MEVGYGVISLLPVAVILAIAIATRRTLFAMFCGTIIGSIILAGNLTGVLDTWFTHVYGAMANPTLQWLCLVVAVFGMLIVLYERTNAVKEFALWARKFIKTEKQALFGTIGLGLIVFIDDYLNNLTVSTTMKGLTDDLRIPRSRLGYLVNTVAAPVCILVPVSSWAVYYAGLLEAEGLTANGSGMGAYIQAIPLTFYAWAILLVAILSTIGIIPPLGLIKKDTQRARETGNVFPEGIVPPSQNIEENEELSKLKPQPFMFLIPLVVMIIVTLLMESQVLIGAIAGVATLAILGLLTKKIKFFKLLEACFDGVASMTFVILLTVLAFSVQGINLELMLTEYVIDITLPVMQGAFLPAVVFVVCAIYGYTTGCFWDLAIIIVPIVIPLANAMGVDPILAAAAIFSGTAFGSNTCLYGDGVILCSQGVEIKPVHLMLATLPYAAIAGGISLVLYLIAGFVM